MSAACLAYGGGSGSSVGRCGGGVGGMVVVLILFLKEGNGGSYGEWSSARSTSTDPFCSSNRP